VHADKMIESLYRYIFHDKSKLYDPCIGRLLTILMKKMFTYFITRLKSLGAEIVFANKNKIIFST
jgi:hypothetical protein